MKSFRDFYAKPFLKAHLRESINNEVNDMSHPEQKFSAGAVSASVWANENTVDGKVIKNQSVTFQKRYKDADGQWKSSSSLMDRDLPNAMVVLAKAYEFMKLRVSDLQPAE